MTQSTMKLMAAGIWLLGACTLGLPDGKLRCATSDDCPPEFVCEPNAASQLRCYREAQHARDAGAVLDAGDAKPRTTMDAAVDARADAPMTPMEPREHDAADPADTMPRQPPKPPQPDAGRPPIVMPPAQSPICEPTKADESNAIFVSPAPVGSSLNNCGTSEAPCATIALGIKRATKTSRAFVYLDTGTYAEAVELVADVGLSGGWDNLAGKWTRHCGAHPERNAVIEAPAAIAVHADYEGSATLDTLTIRALPADAPGQSVYGVFARGEKTKLKLTQVSVEAAHGGNGAAGTTGVGVASTNLTCVPGDGQPGSLAGEQGVGASLGSFDMGGYRPNAAAFGGAGEPGHNGVPAAPDAQTCVQSGTCKVDSASCTSTAAMPAAMSVGGAPGCGGAPGAVGEGGESGGSSIGVFVWSADVSIVRSAVIAGDAGSGGPGGEGGPGLPGSPGVGGGPADCVFCSLSRGLIIAQPNLPLLPFASAALGASQPMAAEQQFASTEVDRVIIQPVPKFVCIERRADAIVGGTGGVGAAGGRGGDGAGGLAYAVYRGAGGKVRLEDTALMHGAAGASPGNGAVGEAADSANDGSAEGS